MIVSIICGERGLAPPALAAHAALAWQAWKTLNRND
jgi:hypothetical protein